MSMATNRVSGTPQQTYKMLAITQRGTRDVIMPLSAPYVPVIHSPSSHPIVSDREKSPKQNGWKVHFGKKDPPELLHPVLAAQKLSGVLFASPHVSVQRTAPHTILFLLSRDQYFWKLPKKRKKSAKIWQLRFRTRIFFLDQNFFWSRKDQKNVLEEGTSVRTASMMR